MSLILAVLALAVPVPADAHVGADHCASRACLVRVARKACERGSIRACVRRGARQHGVDERRLLIVAWCESTMRPWAVNGQAAGLFQFMPVTWASLRYRRHSPFSAKWSSLAAGLAFRLGMERQWECRS